MSDGFRELLACNSKWVGEIYLKPRALLISGPGFYVGWMREEKVRLTVLCDIACVAELWTLGIGQLDIMDNAHSNEIPRVQLSAPMEDCTAMQRTLEQIAFYRELLQLRQPSHTS